MPANGGSAEDEMSLSRGRAAHDRTTCHATSEIQIPNSDIHPKSEIRNPKSEIRNRYAPICVLVIASALFCAAWASESMPAFT
jgi:hypothetical protein